MNITSGKFAVELNHSPFEWDLDAGTFQTVGRPAVAFWLNPSLLRMLQPLVEEVGAPLYRLLVAHHSSLGSEEDYKLFVTVFGTTFEEGFLVWGHAVGSVGWGRFELPLFDRAARRAVVRVINPWELRMQEGLVAKWGCPFLFGKIVGIFSLALGTNCWAEEVEIPASDGVTAVEFHIHPSDKTIASQLEGLRRAAAEEESRPLMEKMALIEQQNAAIRAMETPILQVWDGVLALPIIGVVDARRADEISANLLDAVVRTRARYAVIDLTGVEIVDTATASYFSRIIRGIALLGAECLVCGIRPAVAQSMTAIDVGSGLGRTFGTMQDALQTIIAGDAPKAGGRGGNGARAPRRP